jgi:hypothetical protein
LLEGNHKAVHTELYVLTTQHETRVHTKKVNWYKIAYELMFDGDCFKNNHTDAGRSHPEDKMIVEKKAC